MASFKSTKDFIKRSAKVLGWGSCINDCVMDVGCADGSNSTKCLMELYPKVKRIVAIDIQPDTIVYADYRNPYEKIEYFVSDICKRDTTSIWEGKVNKILSHFCFCYVEDQRSAFQNIYRLLAPGGTAAVRLILQSPIYDWMIDVMIRWRQFQGNSQYLPRSHVEKWTAEYYKEMLLKIGFDVVLFETELHSFKQEAGETCKDYLSSVCSFSLKIPKQLERGYREDIYNTFLKYCKKNKKGELHSTYNVLTVLLKKPLQKTSSLENILSGLTNHKKTGHSFVRKFCKSFRKIIF